MEKVYRVYIEATLTTELSLEELQARIDIGLLEYDVNGDVQSLSLEGYTLDDYAELRVELDEDLTEEINS